MKTKPKPIVTKIQFSKEQLEDIDALLHDRPTKAQIEKHSKMKHATDTAIWLKHRAHVPAKYIHNILKKEYYHGLCHICQAYPTYKVTYDRDGASVIEFWCDKHLPKF